MTIKTTLFATLTLGSYIAVSQPLKSQTTIKDNHGVVNHGTINGPVTIYNGTRADDTIQYLDKIEMSKISITVLADSSSTKANTDNFYYKFKIQNNLSYPVEVQLRVPFGYYRDCIPYPDNFVRGGDWSINKFIPSGAYAYFLINQKLPSRPGANLCTGLAAYTIKAVSKKLANPDSGKYLGEDLSFYYLSEGIEMFRMKEYQDAIIFFNKSMDIEPFEGIYPYRGEAYLHIYDFTNAIDDLEKAIKSTGANAEIHYLLGIGYYSKAITENPAFDVFNISSKPSLFISAYSNLEKACKPDAYWYEDAQIMLLATMYQIWSQTSLRTIITPTKINAAISNLLRKNNRNSEGYYYKAVFSYEMDKDRENALKNIQKAIELDPNDEKYITYRNKLVGNRRHR